MNNGRVDVHRRPRERGQTILLVAVSLVSLLAMAALAIDVVTLYAAHGEMQRAADAAALAGAKAFVDSGVTSDPTNATRQALAQTMATTVINSILPQNKIQGSAPVLVSATADFAKAGNPQITVTLQRTDLPTFFARIWGSRLATVTASAMAEAYNASSSQTSTGSYVPITPKCVKPLLVPNKDPVSTLQFVDPATGLAVAPNTIGEAITLTQACTKNGPGTCQAANLPNNPPLAGTFLPVDVTPNANNLCPSCSGAQDFEQSIECCDFNSYSCGATSVQINVDNGIRHGQLRNQSRNGLQCLTNDPARDTIDVTDLVAGTGPPRITAGSGPQTGNLVTTSNSIANLPIFVADPANPNAPIPPTGKVTVVGFLQIFVDDVGLKSGAGACAGAGTDACIQAHILNVIGCGNNPSGGASVSGGGTSAIPVRLIHQ